MSRSHEMTRRDALTLLAGTAGALATGAALGQNAPAPAPLKGRIKQSVSKWCYGGIPFDKLCAEAKAMGLVGIDLLSEGEWDEPKKAGLICTLANGPGPIPDGWNTEANHAHLIEESKRLIPLVAKAGIPNMIVFSGNRRGISDAQGLDVCEKGLKQIVKVAEDNNVVLIMELLNSKRGHKDYQCDHTAWGVELCKRLNSDHFKLLYDIFHMQIMEGDVCDTLRENIKYIGHVHTGGVPGRNEIDDTQELHYPRIMRALVDAGYKGFVAHEFVPKRDPLTSLKEAVKMCDV